MKWLRHVAAVRHGVSSYTYRRCCRSSGYCSAGNLFLRFTCRFLRQRWLGHSQMSVAHAWLLIMLIFLWLARTRRRVERGGVGDVITFRVIFFFYFFIFSFSFILIFIFIFVDFFPVVCNFCCLN